MASFDEFITSLERDFGPQGKGIKFEVFCKWFLKNDPQWSRVVDEVLPSPVWLEEVEHTLRHITVLSL